ncbi:YraN family protein [bacterium]|nr:YraN family protein [bacterium]
MSEARLAMGAAGEAAALAALQRQGYRLLHRNLRLGRLGELDLVMQEGSVLVFVEVKAKILGERQLGGRDNVTWAKQRKLVDLATAYMQSHANRPGSPKHSGARFDVVEVVYADGTLKNPQVVVLKDAFRPGD